MFCREMCGLNGPPNRSSWLKLLTEKKKFRCTVYFVLNINMVVYIPDVSESTLVVVVDLLALDMCHFGIAQKECRCKECHLGQVLKLGMIHQNCMIKSIDSRSDRRKGILSG